MQVVKDSAREHGTIFVQLDPRYYKKISDFEARFPKGAPSLIDCTRFTIEGDFCFGADVMAHGDVALKNGDSKQVQIEDKAVLR